MPINLLLRCLWVKIFLLSGCAFVVSYSEAQVANYCFSQSAGVYGAISGGTLHVSGALDNGVYSAVNIGFTFNFNGTNYTQVNISTNGFITFGAAPAATNYTPISSGAGYAGAISPMGTNLYELAAGELRSQTFGSSPNMIFVIQWKTYRRTGLFCSPADNINFQITLYETSNRIDIIYGTNTIAASAFCTNAPEVGLRGANNADYNNRTTAANWTATTAGGANNATCTLSNTVFPPSGRTFTWLPAPSAPSTTGNQRCGTGSVSLSASGAGAGEDYKWYDAPTGGTLLQTGGAVYNTPSISVTTTYYVTKYNTTSGCESSPRASVVATINNIPAQPGAISGPSSACGGSSGNVYSIAAVTGATSYTWTLPAGSSITSGAGTTAITVTLGASSGNVTVTADNVCGSSPVQTLAVTVNLTPSAPSVTNASRSGPGTVILSASGAGAGEDYKWYDALTGGTLLQTGGSTYSTPWLTATTTYYAVKYQTSPPNCESAPRTPVTGYIYTARGMDGYVVTRTTGVAYTDISGTGTAVASWRNGSSGENLSNSINIGFNFAFDGGVHTQFRVSTSGYITFNNATNATGSYQPACGTYDCYSSDNTLFTSTGKAGTLQTVAPFYNSIEPEWYALNSTVHYQLSGAAPNRIFTVQWRGMSEWVNSSCSPCDYSDRNFQVKLYESSNNIDFLYSTMYEGWDITDDQYTSGLNSSTLSGAPTAAQLLTQQTENTNTFNNTPKNNLSVSPAANSRIRFTWSAPAVPGAVPGCATMNFPSNGAVNQCLNTILSWGMGSDSPTGYDVYFGTVAAPPLVSSNQKATYYNPGGLAINTTYYWKIVPKNHLGDAAACATYSFSTLVGDVAPTSITSSVVGTGTPTAPVFCRGTTSTITINGGNLSSGSAYNWTAPFIFDLGCKINPPYPLLPINACDDAASFNYTFNSPGTYRWYAFVRGCNNTTSCVSIDVTVLDYDNTTPTSVTTSAGNPICNGTTTTLTATGGTLGAGATTQWYTGSCGGTLVGTGTSIDVTPASTTTYYVRRTGGSTCPNTTSCYTYTLTVNPAPTANAGSNISSCNGTGAITMTGSSAGGSVSNAAWSGGGGLGTWNNNGTATNPADDYFTPTVTEGSFTATLTVTPVCAGTPATSTRVVTWGSYSATYKTWIGVTSNNWFTASNWCDAVPTSTTDALIPANMPNQPTIGAAGAQCRNITINGSATLTISGANNLDVYGDWTRNGTFTPGASGTITFRGNSNQSVGGASANTFQNLTINNTGASGSDNVSLTQPATVDGSLTLTDGILVTTSTNLLTLSSTGTSSAGNSGSFVSGPMRKNGIAAAGSFTFQTGKGTRWARIGLFNVSALSDFQAEYYDAPYTNTTSFAAGIVGVSGKEWWDLTRVSGGNASVRLWWEDGTWSGINSVATNGDLVVAHWGVPTAGNWNDNGSPQVSASCSGSCPTGWVESSVQTSFSPFTFGNKTPGVNPLPVELLQFSAICTEGKVQITWSTASEINNEYFIIEKRDENNDAWKEIGKITGAGNSSSIHNYEFFDEKKSNALVYYRLKQIDTDGNSEYSDIVSVKCSKENLEIVKIIPNPAHNNFTVFFNSSEENDLVKFEVKDMLGRIVQKTNRLTRRGSNAANIEIGNIESGIYFVVIQNDKFSFVYKIAKN